MKINTHDLKFLEGPELHH